LILSSHSQDISALNLFDFTFKFFILELNQFKLHLSSHVGAGAQNVILKELWKSYAHLIFDGKSTVRQIAISENKIKSIFDRNLTLHNISKPSLA
jgi:hypothetical protein